MACFQKLGEPGQAVCVSVIVSAYLEVQIPLEIFSFVIKGWTVLLWPHSQYVPERARLHTNYLIKHVITNIEIFEIYI